MNLLTTALTLAATTALASPAESFILEHKAQHASAFQCLMTLRDGSKVAYYAPTSEGVIFNDQYSLAVLGRFAEKLGPSFHTESDIREKLPAYELLESMERRANFFEAVVTEDNKALNAFNSDRLNPGSYDCGMS